MIGLYEGWFVQDNPPSEYYSSRHLEGLVTLIFAFYIGVITLKRIIVKKSFFKSSK